MKATLILPGVDESTPRRFRLIPQPNAAGEVSGFRVLPATVCRSLNGVRFRDLRDILGAKIETDDVEAAAAILKLSKSTRGLVRRS